MGSRIVRELKEVGLLTLYFLVCFSLVVLLKKLLLAEYDIRITATGTAALGALVMAKVVIVLDHTPVGERFRQGRVVVHVAYRSIIYTVVSMLVVGVEHLHHAYREEGSWAKGWEEVTTPQHLQQMLFTAICVLLIFLAYNLYSEIDRGLGGGGALRAFLASRREERAP